MNLITALETALLKGYAATSGIDISEICVCLGLTTLLALYIFLIYRVFRKDVFYDRGFHLSLIGMALLSASVLLTVQSSIVVSVGMVGALSIVRFRTAVKDPMDLVFLFWSITAGIICGAGFALIAILASLVLTLLLLLVGHLPKGRNSLLLVVSAQTWEWEDTIMQVTEQLCESAKVHSRSVTEAGLNMVIEVRTKQEKLLIGTLMGQPGIYGASLVTHNGEITV